MPEQTHGRIVALTGLSLCLVGSLPSSGCSGRPVRVDRPPDAGSEDTGSDAGAGKTGSARSCHETWVCDDADGDGVGSITEGQSVQWCIPEGEPRAPEACTDCDDSDPELQAWGYLDADGDGAIVEQAEVGCYSLPLPAGYTEHPRSLVDCDDSDPDSASVRYWDGDEDGYAAPDAEPECLPNIEDDPHYTLGGRDCDDANPQVNPGMPEQYDDALDSNCDGASDPVGCEGGDETDDYCTCFDSAVERTSPASGCAGQSDLFIEHVRYCERECRGTVGTMLIVSNRGDTACTGQGDLVVRNDAGETLWEQSIMLDVAPGESQRVAAPLGASGLELRVPEDCDGGTAPVRLDRRYIDCL